MTSYPNENKTNVALNVWWYANKSHSPQDCTLTAEEATLDRFHFNDQNKTGDQNDQNEGRPYE